MRVFLDLDGTLIGPSGSVSDPVWKAIDEATEAGMKFSVCTGRTGAGIALDIAKRVDPTGAHIFENGALITPVVGEPLKVEALDLVDLETLVEHATTTPAVLELYTAQGIFVNRHNADCRLHAQVLDIEVVEADLREVIREHPIARAHWIMRPETLDQTLAVELKHSELGVASSPVLPENVFASITNRGVSKGTAARWITEYFEESTEETAAIGDAPGDRPILDWVAHPFAMQNSPPELRRDYEVVPSVEADGVVEALRRLMRESASVES